MSELSMTELAGFSSARELYRSSSTIVTRALRLRDNLRVVIKYSASEYPALREEAARRNEFDVLTEVQSPNIIRAYGLERVHNRLLLIEEDFDGVSLGTWGRTHDVAISAFLKVAIGVADALVAVHALDIIHRDVSPNNILVDPQTHAVKLIDFGIASRLARESHDLKSPEGIQGTLAYISPEQTCRMNRAVDCRTDLYSLGATFYHLLAKVPPFEDTNKMELVHAHIAKEPRALYDLDETIPLTISDIITKLMSKALETRYQSALGLRHDLQECLKQLTEYGDIFGFELAKRDTPIRFEVPQYMYGREREVDTLLRGFERVAAGSTELLLVGGYSGIGKSSLVREVHKPIVKRRGYFIAGKYDQFNRGIPYSALGQAFTQMVETIFTESAERVASWKAQILDVLGPNGRMVVDVIPVLEQLIGPQLAVSPLPPSEAQSRFGLLFQRFVRIFAQRDHPLVLFLDDMQWADKSSLQFLESLLGKARPPYLYVVTAYRDNEVDAAHPFVLAVDAIKRADTSVHEIALSPLAAEDAGALIAGTLRCTPEQARPLTELLYDRTAGNPFFLIQLLHSLHDRKLLQLDPASQSWTWELASILSTAITHNVVDVLTARIQRLPDSCKAVLKTAACLGGTFDLKTLATVHQAPYHVTAHALWPALCEGLIECGSADYQAADAHDAGAPEQAEIRDRLNDKLREEVDAGRFNVRYRFLHDRVQQAAYLLIPDLHRPTKHLEIGRLLLRLCPSEAQREDKIFELTNHFNLGVDLITDPDELLTLARLNAQAGARARTAAANRAAVRHLSIAIELLGPEAWQPHYELMLALHKSQAECQYLVGDFKESDRLSLLAISHARTNRDRAEAHATRVQLFLTGSELTKALQSGIEALTLLGFDVPTTEDAKQAACARELARINDQLDRTEISALVDLPAIQDLEKAAALELLVHTWCAAYFAQDVTFSRLTVYWMVGTSLDHGNAAASAMGYTLHGMLLASDGDYRRGYQFGLLGKQLNEERYPNPVYTPKVCNVIANSLNPYFNHLETNLPYYMLSYRTGPQVGDIFYSLWAAHLMILVRTMKGDPLAEVFAESDKYLQYIRDIKDQNIINAYDLNRQMIACLRGNTAALGSLDSETFSEAEHVAFYQRTSFHIGTLWYGAFKSGVHVYLGQYAEALEVAALTETVIPYDIGMWSTTNHYFYQTIAIFQVYDTASPARQAEYEVLLARNFAKFAVWSEHGAVNFFHRYQLMLAERARRDGHDIAAAAHYDLSVEHAAKGMFANDEALALELAGKFYRARGRTRVARVYLTDAYYTYARWGALAKTRQMAEECGDLLLIARDPGRDSTTLQSVNQPTREEGNHWLDLVTVLKATQTISSEIVQDKLLSTVMSILTENAGAERGVLLLERKGELIVEVEATGGGATPIQRAVTDYPHLMSGVVNLVYRTKRSVVIDDARRDRRFLTDPYAARVKPRSVLCLPILNQGRLRGIAYFENNLSCGVFTVDRLAVLELLTSQASISIENATLYHELESRVQVRTEELRRSLEELKLAQVDLESANGALRKEIEERQQIELELRLAQKLEAVGRLAAGIAHEINTPIQFVQDNVTFVRDGASDLFGLIGSYRELCAATQDSAPSELIARLARMEHEVDLGFLADKMPHALDQALYGLGRVATLVRSMKEFAHADQHDKAPSDINRALTATLSIANNEYKYVADVRANLGDLPLVVCHISELNQCFLNLIVNAAHAIADAVSGTSERGVIDVTTRVDDDHLVVAISDTGRGIPVAIRDKIFDPFFTTKELGRGTGQGLAIARSVIVDKHGGSLTFETELGRGTTFYIRLPLAADPALAADAARASESREARLGDALTAAS